MSLTLDELSPRSFSRRRTSHATPARRHHTGLGPVCTPVVPARLAPCPALASGRDAGPRGPHRDGRLTGDRAEQRTPRHERPSRLEPGDVVPAPGQPPPVGAARHQPAAPRDVYCPGRRRHGGTPPRPAHHGPRLLARRGALHDATRDSLLWFAVGRDDAGGPRALEPTGVGSAVSHRLVPARRAVHTPTAQDQRGLGTADEAAGAALAAEAAAGVGGRWRLCRGLVGLGLGQTPGGHGLALAVGCGAGASAGHPVPQQARPQTHPREAPAQRARLGRTRGYPLGNRRRGRVRGASVKRCGSSRTRP
jgi:hypothetical protein